ncbi:hypothetical protein [Pradoshia sp.]|uniref:hypothetical protein n=1 Tax=Pradoshia sp. TaxID=2651281 RepID=UPI003F076C21
MSVSIRGQKKLIEELERRFGPQHLQKVSDKALARGAEVVVKEQKSQFESFKDTGASIEETNISKPVTLNGARTVRVHWKGPKGRYRIIHLNEWGTINNPKPRGKGAIARSLRNAEKEYRNVIKQSLKDGL